ncbi:MAG: hypothetical protein R2729_02340 [Bryobacteraceae bacterium]
MDYLDTIQRFYPNAINTSEGVDRLLNLLRRELGLTTSQVMSADSICSDDLNTIEYPQRAYEMLGPFKMGGLNGFPFTGLTGMGAFAHHVPKDGAVFVFYGPHIGISRDGSVGEVFRPGQAGASACCGAAHAALAKLMKNDIRPGDVTELDYQQNTIEQIFLRHGPRITGSVQPLMTATEVMYEAIDQRIGVLVERTSYPSRHLILMGGILINTDHGGRSHVSLRRLDFVRLEDGNHTDMRDEFLASP